MESSATVVPLPKLAEGLILGSCVLVQWRLQEPATGSLGVKLVIDELHDRAGKLREMLVSRRNLDLAASVSQTVLACATLLSRCGAHLACFPLAVRRLLSRCCATVVLLEAARAPQAESVSCSAWRRPEWAGVLDCDGGAMCRLLENYRWSVFDLQSGTGADTTLCQRLCAAVQSTLSTLTFHAPALHAAAITTDTARKLTRAAGACLEILGFVASALPSAIVQLLLLSDTTTAGAPWGPAVVAAVHTGLEARVAEFPASTAFVTILQTLVERLPPSQELLRLVAGVVAGLGCDHVHWRWARPTDCWRLSESVVRLLATALACDVAVLRPPAAAADDSAAQLAAGLLRQGVLTPLLRVRTPPPPCAPASPVTAPGVPHNSRLCRPWCHPQSSRCSERLTCSRRCISAQWHWRSSTCAWRGRSSTRAHLKCCRTCGSSTSTSASAATRLPPACVRTSPQVWRAGLPKSRRPLSALLCASQRWPPTNTALPSTVLPLCALPLCAPPAHSSALCADP